MAQWAKVRTKSWYQNFNIEKDYDYDYDKLFYHIIKKDGKLALFAGKLKTWVKK